jgi:tetratricopeptide (TPR) repeat protein
VIPGELVKRITVSAILLFLGAVPVTLALTSRASEEPATSPVPTAADEFKARDVDIAFYEKRVREDSSSAADRSRLAQLYAQRARATGNESDYERAENQARASLALRTDRNAGTFSVLVNALLARHDFAGALEAAQTLVKVEPEDPSHRAILGETLLEVGRYDEARAVFDSLESHTSSIPVAARLVRNYEITGRLARATAVARYALRLSERSRLPADQRAWFALRLGELRLKAGAIAEADSIFQVGLSMVPGDHRLLAARTRAAALRRDWSAVIELGGQAIAGQLDPGTLGLMSDAFAAIGDTAQGASFAEAMTVSALEQPGPIHRVWGLFLLDHGRDAAGVLKRVHTELASRRDVYGYDLEAWALHTLGRDAEAWRSMAKAVSQGTEDALVWYHAAVIRKSLGDDRGAREWLDRALALNPSFHHLNAAHARALRDSLRLDDSRAY